MDYASLGRRTVAFLLDVLILLVPMAIATHLIPFVGLVIVLFFYAPILEASELRATLGKHLMGIQVSDAMGRRITLRATVVRNLVKYVSVPLLCFSCFFALFTKKRQALHDLLVDSYVIYGRSLHPIGDAWSTGVKELFHTQSSTISSLERLQTLRERGAITEEEFQAEKRKLFEKS